MNLPTSEAVLHHRYYYTEVLDVWAGFGIQPHYKAPSDLGIKKVTNAVINSGLVRLPLGQWPKVGRGTAK